MWLPALPSHAPALVPKRLKVQVNKGLGVQKSHWFRTTRTTFQIFVGRAGSRLFAVFCTQYALIR